MKNKSLLFLSLLSIWATMSQAQSNFKIPETNIIGTGVALKDGQVYVWGERNNYLQGNGEKFVERTAPAQIVQSLSNIVSIAGPQRALNALDINGNVYSWGESRQLGCGAGEFTTPCLSIKGAVQLVAGVEHTLVLNKDGDVWGWGGNGYNRLGSGYLEGKLIISTPIKLNLGGDKIRLIGQAWGGGFAIAQNGHVWAWGNNARNSLAFENTGSRSFEPAPIRVPRLEPYANRIKYIASGFGFGEALLDDGTVIGWGDRAYLGINVGGQISPDPIVIMSDVKKLNVKINTSVALTNDNKLYVWGSGEYSLSGNPRILKKPIGTPVDIGGSGTLESLYYQTETGDIYGVGSNSGQALKPSNKDYENVVWPGNKILIEPITTN